MSAKMKNISKSEVLVLKDQISYQEGQVVSKTLAQKRRAEHHPLLFRQGGGDQHPCFRRGRLCHLSGWGGQDHH